MIVLIVTPEEATQIRDALPAGALRDHVAEYVTPVARTIPSPIPELLICWPFHQVTESFFDAQVAADVYAVVNRVLTRWLRPRRARSNRAARPRRTRTA